MKWGSEEWMTERDELLMRWFNGDREAVAFLMCISRISELWDDLEDKDTVITKAQVDDAMFDALINLPCNPFYNKHRGYLTPLLINAINSWQDANMLATGTRSERALSYTLRNLDIQIIQAIVFITQGYARLREVSPELWRYFGANQDDIDTWLAGETT